MLGWPSPTSPPAPRFLSYVPVFHTPFSLLSFTNFKNQNVFTPPSCRLNRFSLFPSLSPSLCPGWQQYISLSSPPPSAYKKWKTNRTGLTGSQTRRQRNTFCHKCLFRLWGPLMKWPHQVWRYTCALKTHLIQQTDRDHLLHLSTVT